MTGLSSMERALGRIEGTQGEILKKLDKLSEDFGEHKQEDQRNFSSIRHMIDDRLKDASDAREKHLAEQDAKLDKIKEDQDKAKGAGWVIIGILGSLATFLGGAVLSVVNGWIKLH